MHRRPGISPSRVVLSCSGCRGPSQRNRWHSLSDQFSQRTAGPFRKRGARWGWNVPRVVTMAHFCTHFNFWVLYLLPFATKKIEWFGEIHWQLPSISSLTQIVSSWAKEKKNSPGVPCKTNYWVLICLFPPTHHTWRVGRRMFKMSSSVPMIQQRRQAWRLMLPGRVLSAATEGRPGVCGNPRNEWLTVTAECMLELSLQEESGLAQIDRWVRKQSNWRDQCVQRLRYMGWPG